MHGIKSNEDILRDANVRLCRLRTWPNYKGLGFYLSECTQPPHLITIVESNSPAAAGGLKINDVLLAVNTEVTSEADYAQIIVILKAAQDTHRPVELLVVGQRYYTILKKKNITIDSSLANMLSTPIKMPKDYIKFSKNIPRTCHICLQTKDTGFGFCVIGGNDGIGVFIQEVTPGSPAYRAELRKSDRIIEINDKYVDKETDKFIIEKLNKALTRRTVKLLVVDTGTYECPVLSNPDVDGDDAYLVDQLVSHEKIEVSLTDRSRSNSDVLTLNGSNYEYIALENNQRLTKTTASSVKNRNDQDEFHSLNCPLNQNKTLTSSQQDHSNPEHTNKDNQRFDYKLQGVTTVQYEYPHDYNYSMSTSSNLASNETISFTLCTSHFYENIPFGSRHQYNATSTTCPTEQNDNSDYLEPSTILLQLDENDHNIQENDLTNIECVTRLGHLTNDDDCHRANHRFIDVQNEPLVIMLPIEGYEDTPRLPLNTAVDNLEKIIHKIKRNAWIAFERSTQPSDGLTSDESASIQLYTMEWKPGHQPLSMQINAALRAEDRDLLIPYFSYFKLVLTALWKLKSIETKVWRGVKGDVRVQYPIGKTFVWWGFSSCMKSCDLLESDKYLGTKGIRTLFDIECKTGKSIHSHSYNENENEILLLPATQFEVINQDKLTDDLYIISVKEISPRYTLLQPPFDTDYLSVQPKIDENILQKKRNLFHNQYLQELINNHKMERTFSIHEQPITINDMHLIANEIQSNKYWCTISIHRIRLDEEHITILMNALKSNLIVTSLDLRSNQLDDNTSSILARILKTNTYLETIDLSDNQITEIGTLSFANMLLVNRTLLNLNLSSNIIGDNGMISIILALQHNDVLESLYLNRTKLTDKSGLAMAIDLELNTNLKVLYLNENNLGDVGTISIFRSLTQNKQLKGLHLAMNNITYVGAEKFAILLRQTNSSLSELNISGNPLRDLGVILIAQALTSNTTLIELHLDSVEMTIDGLRELIKMLRVNNTLKYLSLKKNEIDDDGMILLLNGLQCNNVLTHLYLNMNKITDGCVTSIGHLLKINNTLKYLCLSDNQLTEQGKLTLNETTRIDLTECL